MFGDSPKEQLLGFFAGYIVILSIILSFVISSIHSSYTLNLLNLPVQTSFSIGSVGGLFNLFGTILLWAIPDQLLPMYIQLPFLIFPKVMIGIILLSYIKDML